MISIFLPRILSAIFVVIGVACLVFLVIHVIPGDPVDVMLGESARPADKDALRQALGLHLSLEEQFVQYVKGLVTLNWGTSIFSGRSVSNLLMERLPATIELGLAALLVAIIIAFPLGILAAIRHRTWADFSAMGFAILGVSIPNFLLGPLLIMIGALWLGWFPVSGREDWSSLFLPALTLGTSMAAILSRMVRSTLLEVINEDFVRTARAKGLPEWKVMIHHCLQNALLPILTLLGLQLGALLGGAVITETVFSWPGVGLLTVEAIQQRDYPVVQAAVLCISLTYVMINFLTDILYYWIDPRINIGTQP